MNIQSKMCRLVLAVIGIVGLCSAPAVAGPLATDGNAMPAWQGTVTFDATSGGEHLLADVEYAVFAPGDYQSSGTDPSGGSDYVYTYQIFNDLTGDQLISALEVGITLHPTLPILPGNIGSDATSGTAGGTAPTFSSFIGAPPTGAGWYFPSNTIDPSPTNEYSEVLIFTSGAAPHMVSSTLLNSGLSAVMDLPSPLPDPLPEPASLALIAVGLAGVFGSRRRKK